MRSFAWFTDVATEKTQKSLFEGIEKFDASRLKHTEVQEKNPLPDKDGIFMFLLLLPLCTYTYIQYSLLCNWLLLITYTQNMARFDAINCAHKTYVSSCRRYKGSRP